MIFRRMLPLACATLFLTGCGSKLTSENFNRVTKEMTRQEVETILGKPTEVETLEIPLFATTSYVYKQGKNEVRLVFLNDKLLTKDGTFSK